MAEEDLFLLISQNNTKKTVKVKQVSEALAQLLGRLRSELEGQLLSDFLGSKATDTLAEYLEYDDESDDVDRILGRVQKFTLKAHNGDEILFAHKIYRAAPLDEHQWFEIHLKDERRQIEEQSLPKLLRDNMAGIISLDDATGLADRNSCQQYLNQVASYVGTHQVKACFAVLRLDRHQKSLAQYGQSGCEALLKHVAQDCKGRFREEDLVSRINDDKLGLLLMDTTAETARIVLNRLRWSIASHHIAFGGKTNFSVTVSVTFREMLGESGQDAMNVVESAAEAIELDERSQLVEAAL